MPLVTPIIDSPGKRLLRARWGPLNSGDWGGDFVIGHAKSVTVSVEFPTGGGTFGDGAITLRGKARIDDPTYGASVGGPFTSHTIHTVSDHISNRAVYSLHPTVSGTTATGLYVTAVAKYD